MKMKTLRSLVAHGASGQAGASESVPPMLERVQPRAGSLILDKGIMHEASECFISRRSPSPQAPFSAAVPVPERCYLLPGAGF